MPLPTRRSILALATASLLALAGGCARLMHAAGNGYGPDPVHIVFVNQTTDQAAVYAVMESGETERIGTVLPGRADTLTVPAALVANGSGIAIAARLLAKGGAPRTGMLSLNAGDMYEVVLQADERAMRVIRLASPS